MFVFIASYVKKRLTAWASFLKTHKPSQLGGQRKEKIARVRFP